MRENDNEQIEVPIEDNDEIKKAKEKIEKELNLYFAYLESSNKNSSGNVSSAYDLHKDCNLQLRIKYLCGKSAYELATFWS